MTERPILMAAPMVRATLADIKTQTRRIAPIRDLNIIRHPGDMVTWAVSFLKAVKGVLGSHSGGKFSEIQARSIIASQFNPYGRPGDRLWVRESYSGPYELTGTPPRDWTPGVPIWYWADGNPTHVDLTRPKPGMHMPRWASRITLEITAVRVERLQDISEADAKAEGIEQDDYGYWLGPSLPSHNTPTEAFRDLWASINGPGSWHANPWVWVVEFRRIKP